MFLIKIVEHFFVLGLDVFLNPWQFPRVMGGGVKSSGERGSGAWIEGGGVGGGTLLSRARRRRLLAREDVGGGEGGDVLAISYE